MHTAHLIVCGVLTPERATIFQRIMSDSVVSNHCTGYAPDGLISLLVIAWSLGPRTLSLFKPTRTCVLT
jgi:hypothetical protein